MGSAWVILSNGIPCMVLRSEDEWGSFGVQIAEQMKGDGWSLEFQDSNRMVFLKRGEDGWPKRHYFDKYQTQMWV